MPSIDVWFKKYFLLTFIFILMGTSLNASGSWTQLGDDIDGENPKDRSGNSVSMSADGRRVAIGARINDGKNGSNSGHVRIYEYSNGSGWTQLGSDIDGEAAGDQSGYSVSLSGDGSRVAIGATLNDGKNGSNSGHVRIYEYSGGSWTQLGSDLDGEGPNENSGYSVSLSVDGRRVAIGAIYNGDNGVKAGHVRIYEYSDVGGWTQLGSDIDGEVGDMSGWSVSLSGDGSRVAIGAPYSDGGIFNLLTDRGKVRIYEYSGGSWIQLGSGIDGEVANDESGSSVSLSADGRRVAIGAYKNDGYLGLYANIGHVRIYEYSDGSGWTQLGSNIYGEKLLDQSGYSVSLSANGSRVAIGASLNDGTNTYSGDNKGHVRIYEYSNGSNWIQLGSDIDGEAAGDQSGYSVSLSGDGSRLGIGAPLNMGGFSTYPAGHARIYGLSYPCGNTITALTEYKWWSVSRPCGTTTNPTIKEIFADSPVGAGLGVYGDNNDWVMWKLNGTNPDGTENYTMITDPHEVMKSGVGYWIITSTPGVNWNPGAIGESAEVNDGARWNVNTEGTVMPDSLSITGTEVQEFLVVDPVADLNLALVQENQLALLGNPFNKAITWSNVYFSNDNGSTYEPIDGITSGVRQIAYVSDPNVASGQPYEAISSVAGFKHSIEPNQAFWIKMIDGSTTPHSSKRIALPLEY